MKTSDVASLLCRPLMFRSVCLLSPVLKGEFMIVLFAGFDVGPWLKVDSGFHVGPCDWVGLIIGSEAQIYNEAYASFHRPSGLPEN